MHHLAAFTALCDGWLCDYVRVVQCCHRPSWLTHRPRRRVYSVYPDTGLTPLRVVVASPSRSFMWNVSLTDHVAASMIQKQYRAHRRRVIAARLQRLLLKLRADVPCRASRLVDSHRAAKAGLAVVAVVAAALCGVVSQFTAAEVEVRSGVWVPPVACFGRWLYVTALVFACAVLVVCVCGADVVVVVPGGYALPVVRRVPSDDAAAVLLVAAMGGTVCEFTCRFV